MPHRLRVRVDGPQQGEEGLIEAFTSAIPLWVVRGRPALSTPLEVAQLLHNGGLERPPLVGQ